jgi:ribosomal protein L37E
MSVMEKMKIECSKCGTENTSNAKYCCGCGYELQKIEVEDTNQENAISKNKQQGNKKRLSTANIVGLIVGLVVCAAVQQLFFKIPSIDKAMMKVANEINKTCPIMLDADTRLDNTIALPNKVFQYNYTLVNWEKSTIDTVALKNYVEPRVINDVKTNPQMQFQRDHKVTMGYYYKDKEGAYVCAVYVTPADYE